MFCYPLLSLLSLWSKESFPVFQIVEMVKRPGWLDFVINFCTIETLICYFIKVRCENSVCDDYTIQTLGLVAQWVVDSVNPITKCVKPNIGIKNMCRDLSVQSLKMDGTKWAGSVSCWKLWIVQPVSWSGQSLREIKWMGWKTC